MHGKYSKNDFEKSGKMNKKVTTLFKKSRGLPFLLSLHYVTSYLVLNIWGENMKIVEIHYIVAGFNSNTMFNAIIIQFVSI